MNCLDRKLGCHSACERYKAFKEQTYKEYQMRIVDDTITSYEIKRGKRLFGGRKKR
jgi:hypothetical protein